MSRAGAERERPEAKRSWRSPPFLTGSFFSGSATSRALEAMDRMVVSSSGGLGERRFPPPLVFLLASCRGFPEAMAEYRGRARQGHDRGSRGGDRGAGHGSQSSGRCLMAKFTVVAVKAMAAAASWSDPWSAKDVSEALPSTLRNRRVRTWWYLPRTCLRRQSSWPPRPSGTDEVVSCGGRGRDCCGRDNFRGAQVRGRDGAVSKVVAAVTKVVAGGERTFYLASGGRDLAVVWLASRSWLRGSEGRDRNEQRRADGT